MGIGAGAAALFRATALLRPQVTMLDVNDAWDNTTSQTAASRIDAISARAAERLGPTTSAAPRRRGLRQHGALSNDAASDTQAMLDTRRKRLSGALEEEHREEINSALKMARLWPTAKGRLQELLRVRGYMSASTDLSRRYHEALAEAYAEAGSKERAKEIRRRYGLPQPAEPGPAAQSASSAPGNTEMSKLLDLDSFDSASY